jgi:drug/metabolite transporter (DMT)-like permease
MNLQPSAPFAVKKEPAQPSVNEDRPLLATMFYLAYSFLYVLNFVAAQYLFRRNSDLGSFQLLYARSVISIATLALFFGRNLKTDTIDKVRGQPKAALVFRSVQSGWSNIIKTIGAAYISLLMISLVASTGPLFAVALAWCLLGETIRPFEGLILLL